MSINALAARAITTHAANPAEARLFLNMLGLLDGEQIAPDDTKIYMLGAADVSVTRAAMVEHNARPKVSTAPAALRILPDLPKEPAKRTRSTRPRAAQKPCGTETAAKRHRRLGEIDDEGRLLCQVCLDGRAARNNNLNREFKPCGTPAAYQRHMKADGRVTCQPCRDAHSAASADRRSKRDRKPNSRKKAAA